MKKALFLFLFSLVIPFTSSCGKDDDYPGSSGTGGGGYSTVSISSLNGKTFYEYFPGDNEARIAGVETFPYIYTIPEGVDSSTSAFFEYLTIKDNKVYWSSISVDVVGNTATYNLDEKEQELIEINNRYFLQHNGSEIMFTNDMIFVEGNMFLTKERIEEKEASIYSIETQHNNWLYRTVISKVDQNLYLNVLETLSNENQTVTLPSKDNVTFNEVNYEVSIQYELSGSHPAFELNGYELSAKAFDPVTLTFDAKLGFPEHNFFINREHSLNLFTV